jgi:predicted ATPase with chaperone activity
MIGPSGAGKSMLARRRPSILPPLEPSEMPKETVIARANHRIAYPSRIQLIAAMNPCRRGRAGEPGYVCRQGRSCAERYQARISGPLLDRIDLQIEVPAVSAADLVLPTASEGSADVRARVALARSIQSERYARFDPVRAIRETRLPAHPHQRRMRRNVARGGRLAGPRG